MEPGDFKEKCFFCEKKFSFGPHKYDGRAIGKYKIVSCNICLSGNMDGLGPRYEGKFIEHLKSEGISIPDRYENGLLKL